MSMSERKRYHIGNEHDECSEPKWVNVPDYYPLADEEIATLLAAAQGTSDAFELRSIELRFCQGIWGYTSHEGLHSPVGYAAKRLRLLYRQNYHRGSSPELIWELSRWMS